MQIVLIEKIDYSCNFVFFFEIDELSSRRREEEMSYLNSTIE